VTHRDAYALLLVVALIWAGNFPLAKLGLSELGPITLAALRALIAAPLLVLASRVIEGPLPRLARRDLTAVIVLAVTGFVGNSTLWYTGMRFTTPANAGILGAAAPVVLASTHERALEIVPLDRLRAHAVDVPSDPSSLE